MNKRLNISAFSVNNMLSWNKEPVPIEKKRGK